MRFPFCRSQVSKNLCFPFVFVGFSAPGGVQDGSLFGSRFGVVLEASWRRLGGVLGRLGASWGRLESVLGASWGRLGSVLGVSWERLGNVLGPSWNILKCLGSIFVSLGAVLEMSWKVFRSLICLLFILFDFRPNSYQILVEF